MNEQMRMNLDGARDRCAKLATAAVEAIEFFNDIEKELKESQEDGGDINDTNKEPAEPLALNEQLRKIVRAWAKLHGTEQVKALHYSYKSRNTTLLVAVDLEHEPELELPGSIGKNDGRYTISELCREDERNNGSVKRYEPGMPKRVIFERMKQDLADWINKNDVRSIQTYVHTEPDGRRGVQFVDKTNAGHNQLTIIGWPTIGLIDGARYTPAELLTTREEAE